MELRAFATKVKALGSLIRGLTLAIVAASLAGTALAADLNQHGLTGSWYNPALADRASRSRSIRTRSLRGSGTCREVGQPSPSAGKLGQRWYTFGGPVYRGGKGREVQCLPEHRRATSTLHLQPRARKSERVADGPRLLHSRHGVRIPAP